MSKINRIAITGTMGSGKTEVSIYLRSLGYEVFDCDKTNAMLLEKGNKGYMEVRKAFPLCIVDGELDKKLLADKIFNYKSAKRLLEDIMHPLILEELNKSKAKPIIAEVPLLFEANWDKYFDYILLIVTKENIALERLKNKGVEEDEAIKRIKQQMPVQEKIKRADKIIYNNGSLDELHDSIDKWLLKIL